MLAVLDTNIFVAALLNISGAPAKIRQHWRQQHFDVLVSSPILDEYTTVFSLLPNIALHDATLLLAELSLFAKKVSITGKLQVCKDADDDKFLETAVTGNADFLVTKNHKHFPRKYFEQVRIVKVATFLKEIEKRFPT